MPSVRFMVFASLLPLTIACGTRRPPDYEVQSISFGRFAFVADLPGGQRLTGTIDVAPDTVVARTAAGECRVSPSQPGREVLVYECQLPGTTGINLQIDRRNPSRKSRWSLLTQVTKKRDICTEYRTWENGTRTCARSMPEEYLEKVRVEGSLVVTPP